MKIMHSPSPYILKIRGIFQLSPESGDPSSSSISQNTTYKIIMDYPKGDFSSSTRISTVEERIQIENEFPHLLFQLLEMVKTVESLKLNQILSP